MTNIPLVDLAAQHREVADEVADGWAGVLERTAFINGPQVNIVTINQSSPLNNPNFITTIPSVLFTAGTGNENRRALARSISGQPATGRVISLTEAYVSD